MRSIKDILPSIKIDPNTKHREKAEKMLANKLIYKKILLNLLNQTNIWNQTAILVSNTDGNGKYNIQDHSSFYSAALKYKSFVWKNWIVIDSATSKHLKYIIQDNDFQNIIVIGHASYHSWRACDKSIDCFDLGNMIDTHLKNGVFLNIGCWWIDSWNMIPLGYFVVSDEDNLWWYEAEYAYSDSLWNISNLKRLKKLPSLETFL